MQGLSMKSLMHHKALLPLFACVGVGAAGATYYLLRLAFRNPDVAWTRNSKPEPWQDYKAKQYKFWNSGRDKIECPAPEY